MVDVFLVGTVQQQTIASTSGSGRKTFNTAATLAAKIIYKEELFKSATTGERMLSKTQIVVKPSVTINVGDRIIVDSVNYEVGFICAAKAFKKTDHKKAFLV